MSHHAHLPAMMGLVREHIAQHLYANRPRPGPAVSAKLLDATIAAEGFGEHLRATRRTLAQCCARLLPGAMSAMELEWNLQMRRGKPDPLAANIVHVRKYGRDGAGAGFARGSACRWFRFPKDRVKIFDEHLVYAIAQQEHPSTWVLDVTKAFCCHTIRLLNDVYTIENRRS